MQKIFLGIVVVLLFIGAGYVLFNADQVAIAPEPETGELETTPDQGEEEVTELPGERTVSLYYYDPSRDEDAQGNIMCSEEGLVPVSRQIASFTPVEDTLRLLLEGNLTAQERAAGITTEYPLQDVSLESVALSSDGVLAVELEDPQHQTGGGSCRTGILWAQIRETALQFPEVREVSFQPEDLFQP